MHDYKDAIAGSLGGSTETPKKEIKHVITRKSKNGGHIHEHHHTHPDHHPMEEHTTHGDDAMVEHLLQHMGTPNPGEAEAEAGQSGTPAPAPSASPNPPGIPAA